MSKPQAKRRSFYNQGYDHEDIEPEEFIDYSDAETDTIPRINQKLYKLMKSLKHKEIEWVDDNNQIVSLLM